MRVVVVGLGVMGLSAAAELAARGHDVVGLDRGDVGNRLASSSGASRIYRLAHADRGWVRLAVWNHELWARLERDAERPLRWPRGLVWRGGLSDGVADALAAEAVEHEVLDQTRQAAVFPELRWRPEMLSVWQPDAGAIRADEALFATAAKFQRSGGTIVSGATVIEISQPDGATSGVTVVAERARERQTWVADRVVLTPGPWAGPLLAELGVQVVLRPFLEQVTYVRGGDAVPWADRPCVIDPPADASSFGFYAMPTPGIGYKIGIDDTIGAFDPDEPDRSPRQWREDEAVARLRAEISAFDATPIRSEVCAWTESADDGFVIDRVGEVFFGCGDSGQGFKFLPMFGQIFADLVEGRALPKGVAADVASLFGLSRFRGGATAGESRQGSVGGEV